MLEQAAKLPPIDSLNLWPWLSGNHPDSPRTVLRLSSNHNPCTLGTDPERAIYQGILVPPYKLLLGPLLYPVWTSAVYPNSSGPPVPLYSFLQCGDPQGLLFPLGDGCLFDLDQDPTEHTNLAAALPLVVQRLQEQMLNNSFFYNPNRGLPQEKLLCEAVASEWDGHLGPFV